jgi:pentatricopeptide repeat protein
MNGCLFVFKTYRCAVYAFVHCGEGGSALEILERMNAAGLPPAMTVPEVLIKVRLLELDASLVVIQTNSTTDASHIHGLNLSSLTAYLLCI